MNKSHYINATHLALQKLSETISPLHIIDRNLEYISPNDPKPNPMDTYGPGALHCQNFYRDK